MSDVYKKAMRHKCEHCGAPRSCPCITRDLSVADRPHRVRLAAAVSASLRMMRKQQRQLEANLGVAP